MSPVVGLNQVIDNSGCCLAYADGSVFAFEEAEFYARRVGVERYRSGDQQRSAQR